MLELGNRTFTTLGLAGAAVIVLGVGAVLAAGLYFAASERVESTYANYADAKRAGAIERGWIPAFVPRSATDIQESHDLDTNRQHLRFGAPTADLEAIVDGMVRLTSSQAKDIEGYAPGAAANLDVYRDTTVTLGAGCVAVDFRNAMAYAWTCQ